MAIVNLFSKRQKALYGDVPDVYRYDNLPETLKTQIVHIWFDTLGNEEQYYGYGYGGNDNVIMAYQNIVDMLRREYGLFRLPASDGHNDRSYIGELIRYFLHGKDIDRQLDIIELSFRYIDQYTRKFQYLRRDNASKHVDNAIAELNSRFREHGIGFQFVGGEIVRVDSELLHVETVKPILRLLNEKGYSGAQEEFLSAYDHYRHGRHKESLNECLKAFESTMKAICDKRKWEYDKKRASARPLIHICFENGLVPEFWEQQFSSLRSMLESSIAPGRNKLSGHGQGSTPTSVPDYLVAYMLHMTASTLLFLTTAEKKLP